MKKSADITKYNLKWQLVRVAARQHASVEDKVATAMEYFNDDINKHSYERVLNWLQGLHMGYRRSSQTACDYIDTIIEQVKNTEVVRSDDIDIAVTTVGDKELLRLYKDLYTRGVKWLDKGYIHEEHEAFMDNIAFELKNRNIKTKHDVYLDKRLDAYGMENKHKFFF